MVMFGWVFVPHLVDLLTFRFIHWTDQRRDMKSIKLRSHSHLIQPLQNISCLCLYVIYVIYTSHPRECSKPAQTPEPSHPNPFPIPSSNRVNPPVTRSTNPTGGSKINTWKCSIALTLFNSPQFLNQTTFFSPQTREKVCLTNPSISALLAGTRSSVKGSEGKENLVQTTRCTIRVSRP
jgi:hypothetical protein